MDYFAVLFTENSIQMSIFYTKRKIKSSELVKNEQKSKQNNANREV